jgi:hypothetical protein
MVIPIPIKSFITHKDHDFVISRSSLCYRTAHVLGLNDLALISASTFGRHFVQHFLPSEAVVILAPAHPVHGIPQLGHDTLAILLLVLR